MRLANAVQAPFERPWTSLPLAILSAVAALVLTLLGVPVTEPLIIERAPPEVVSALLALLVMATVFGALVLRARRRYRSAERSALLDCLTGVANRLAFEERLRSEWERSVRHNRPLGVILLDVDGLKEINDTFGHTAGDEVLRSVGAVLSGRVRGSDLAARIGGDEFVVLTTETRFQGLERLATSLREALSELPVLVSLGWTERTARDSDAKDLLHRADLAMYRDKERRSSSAAASAGVPADGTSLASL